MTTPGSAFSPAPSSSVGRMLRRTAQIAFFVVLALSIYGGAVHASTRAVTGPLEALGHAGWAAAARALLLFSAFAFLAARLVERWHASAFTRVLNWAGGLWMAWALYTLMGMGFARLVFLGFAGFGHPLDAPWRIGADLGAAALSMLVTLAGVAAARATAIRRETLALPFAGPPKTWKVLVASDLHLSSVHGRAHVAKLVRIAEREAVDLVLLPGDVVDGELKPVLEHDLGDLLPKLRGRLGVFAVTGNHEYIGGAEAAVRYLREHGLTVLRNEHRVVEGVVIAGRDDRASASFGGGPRPSLAEVLDGAPSGAPVILLDHTPAHLEDAEEAGVALQLSGHTHHGQLWPLHLITKRVFEVSRGRHRRGATTYFVSSGYGTWGPPVRTTARGEVILWTLEFGKS